MAETKPDKPGFLSRLFGRQEQPPETQSPESESAQDQSPEAPASEPMSRPLPEPPVTGFDELPSVEDLPPELLGADLQPIDPNDEGHPALRDITPPAPAPEKQNWWQRLRDGMRRTSSSLSDSVTNLFTKRKLDAQTLEDLEDALVQADLGVETATRITQAIAKGRFDKEIAPDEVKAILAGEVEKALLPVAKPLVIDRGHKPYVILMVGVNGSGKTTTIGKLSQKFRDQGLSVMLAAGDTFRAAAIEQLKVWGERVGVPVLAREQGSDAAGLAYDALQEAKAKGTDVLLIDTAGRLQNKAGLMAELEKIIRVIKKFEPSAPHATLLVLDATVGQNALSQVELFQKAAGISGLVMTKLDGTARGGILVALAAKFGLPVHFIGVGEGVADLEPFAAGDFARAIAGLEE